MRRIALIGAGQLAGSLIRGLIEHGVSPSELAVADRVSSQAEALAGKHSGLAIHTSNQAAAADCDILIACVKPGELRTVCEEVGSVLQAGSATLVSVAAGVTLAMLEKWLRHTPPMVRCMPNTPIAVGCGMTALYPNAVISVAQRDCVERIFASVGEVLWVEDEAMMDLITALSGSGPAYFFRVIESLTRAATTLGMDAKTAHRLAVQTALGAATLAQHHDDDVATLRAAVTSKGGTTEHALASLNQDNIDALFERALRQATTRSREISRELDSG